MKKTIIALLLLIITFTARSQLEVQLGASKTDLKNNAITIGLTYLKSLDSIFGFEHFVPGKKSFFLVTPELDLHTGTEDAYSSIVAKASGLFASFKTTTVAGLTTPDFNKTFHVFPVSVGIESNNSFNTINGILEAGWIPYYQSYGRNSPNWLKKTHIGVFLQAGYKFNLDTAGSNAIGGEIDESSEAPDNGIFRAKGSAQVNTGQIINISGFRIGLVGDADVWYDFLNSEVYHKLQGEVRVYLTEDQYLSFFFSKGSGAPLFNGANQIGMGVTLNF